MDLKETINLGKQEQRILEYLLSHNESFSRQIEHDLYIRQPVASISLNNLLKGGYIKRKIKQSKGKGRPQFIYYISNKKYVVNTIISDMKKQLNKFNHQLSEFESELKKLI